MTRTSQKLLPLPEEEDALAPLTRCPFNMDRSADGYNDSRSKHGAAGTIMVTHNRRMALDWTGLYAVVTVP